MVNKAKKQGTTYETNIVNRLNKEVDFKAQRFAEGGSKDLGDIQLFVKDEEYFLEAISSEELLIFANSEIFLIVVSPIDLFGTFIILSKDRSSFD